MEALGNSQRSQSPLIGRKARKKKSLFLKVAIGCAVVVLFFALGVLWLAYKASVVKSELEEAINLLPPLRSAITENDLPRAGETVRGMTVHTAAARAAANDPVWAAVRTLPYIGTNFAAVSEIATAADDVVRLGAVPLADAFQALDWKTLVPSSHGISWEGLDTQLPKISAAAYAVRTSEERLRNMESEGLLPQVAGRLHESVDELASVSKSLDAASDAANLAPGMLGQGTSRTYLLMVQNNAEARASGGIPGALAEINLADGKLSLGAQRSAGDLGVVSPPLEIEAEQRQIYSPRAGKFMQDVNLTPDFPTAAATARLMWERKTGKKVDGVISVDPVALSYILKAIGPVNLTSPELTALAVDGLSTELNGDNVVRTLLSDIYSKVDNPKFQDAYFAGVAQEVFAALSVGKGDAKNLIDGLTRGTAEGRILVWSASSTEQSVIARYPISGSIAGPSVSPAQFGVYFNDGTGAKMDYYVRRTVELVKECPKDGYEQTTVRVTSTNTAPPDAATSLPSYVTGDGGFGVPSGSVQTNIVAYGPVQSLIGTAKLDGQRTPFAPYLHSNRPVGVLALRLAPGESRTVEFTFGKIVQHTEPVVFVTPSVQAAEDVILPTRTAACS